MVEPVPTFFFSLPPPTTDVTLDVSIKYLVPTHYLVYDEQQVKQFAALIGPGMHQLFIAARPKYSRPPGMKREEADEFVSSDATDNPEVDNHPKQDKSSIRARHMSPRNLVDADPEAFLSAVRKYEVPLTFYKDRGILIPTDNMVIYSTTNPRNPRQAAKKLATELLNAGFDHRDDDYFNHLESHLTSAIMSSKQKTNWVTIDIDDKSEYAEVRDLLKSFGMTPTVIETRGGYHVLFDPVHPKTGQVYKAFSKKHTMGDTFAPVPGTIQGGFPVRFVPFA